MSATRRNFLKTVCGASTLMTLSPAVPEFLLRASQAATPDPEGRPTALVVVQLSGGNDGLNTVVPYTNDAYGRGRTTLRLTEKDVHKINDELGFHPSMAQTLRLFRDGQLSVVQGVGYPNSNRNHDDALRDWHTARPGDAACQTGWLGRAMDAVSEPNRPSTPGVCVAPLPKPVLMNAEATVAPTVTSANQYVLRDVPQSAPIEGDSDNALVGFVSRGLSVSYASSRQVQEVLKDSGNRVEYPAFPLAQQLKTVVELVRAKLGIRMFFTELGGGGIGGFDNHANQRDNHAAVLHELSESLAAFSDDLRHYKLQEDVLLMTFSEFGRTLRENGRRGTDHGAAAPVLLVGGRLRGGLVGEHPGLTDLDGDSPRHHTDYRELYATVLDKWLGFPSQKVLGKQYKHIEIIRG
jgi:uncharacterized protein (DUF1501 family)